MDRVRDEAVAGMFYPELPGVLERVVRGMLARSKRNAVKRPKALIVPHAGYVYSGQAAADAYACLGGWADAVERVVLLGPAHRVAIRGLALPGVDWFRSPLGMVAIDADGVRAISSLPQVVTSAQAHAAEHSLEVQLPFLQTVLGRFTLVPLVVGSVSAEEVAEVIEALYAGGLPTREACGNTLRTMTACARPGCCGSACSFTTISVADICCRRPVRSI